MVKKIIVLAGVVCFALSGCAKPMYKEKFVVSGTFLEVTSDDRSAPRVAHEEIKRLEKIFDFYDPGSELSRLNAVYDKPVKVSDELLEVLEVAVQASRVSGGAFDVSGGALFKFWKELINQGGVQALPAQAQVDRLKELCGMDNLKIDHEQKTVTVKRRGLLIDLGGIAKGYMVDKAAQKLKSAGVKNALISLGGHIYCLGENRGAAWQIGIRDPDQAGGVIAHQELRNEATATSGDYQQYFELNGRRYSHIIDPRTGFPVEGNVAGVTVITQNCTTADALATAFFVMGLDGVDKYLKTNPSTMRIFVIIREKNGKRVHFFK